MGASSFLDLYQIDQASHLLDCKCQIPMEVVMYIDTVVASGLVIVALVCVMAAYIGVFAYKHIKQDIADSDKKNAQK